MPSLLTCFFCLLSKYGSLGLPAQEARLAAGQEVCNGPLRVSSCRLSSEEVATLQRLYKSDTFGHQRVQELRASALRAPDPPSFSSRREITALEPPRAVEDGEELRTWVPALCRHRAHFADAALRLAFQGGEVRYFLFLFAVQTPYSVSFLPLEVAQPVLPAYDLARVRLRDLADVAFDHEFSYQLGKYVYDRDIPADVPVDISVLRNMTFTGGMTASSHDDWVPLPVFLEGLDVAGPSVKRARTSAAEKVAPQNLSGRGQWKP